MEPSDDDDNDIDKKSIEKIINLCKKTKWKEKLVKEAVSKMPMSWIKKILNRMESSDDDDENILTSILKNLN